MTDSQTSSDFDAYAYQPDTEPYRVAGIPGWLDELSLHEAEPHHRMGTRAIDATHPWECFLIDAHRDAELKLRNRLIDEQRVVVHQRVHGTTAAASEVRDLVDGFLEAQDLPSTNRTEEPLVAAGRMVQEDLCLMVRHADGGWYLDEALLCFPSLWSLREKIGQHIADVHGFVPHYGSDLAERIDRFFDRMPIGRIVWRRNLSIKPYCLPCLPFAKSATLPVAHPAGEDGSPYWLRTEYQTLQRLSGSDAILFTIKTQHAPLGVLRERPAIARGLAAQLGSWSEDMHEYKTAGSELRTNVVPWLIEVGSLAD
jgi:dimethylamine monooxygenase subunit A